LTINNFDMAEKTW